MTVSETIETVVKGLSPTFLGLCVINAMFLAVFGWFALRMTELRAANEAIRLTAMEKLLTACIANTKEPH